MRRSAPSSVVALEVAPSASDPITATLREIRTRIGADARGDVADYIPRLSSADPNLFGLALASVEGHVYQAGDAATSFTLQSVSKPFVYALALSDHGIDEVVSRVGAEPSGEAFNAMSLESTTGRPANPMINAGAIVTTSLVRGADPVARFERIREKLEAFAGRRLPIDEEVFASERETGDRNRALAYLMRSAGSLRCSVDDALDVYFRQCAVSATAADVAMMAATLANGGVNPRTRRAVVQPHVAEHVLAVMATCGMYDYAGEWLLRVGLPAKSGVSGGLVAVSPGQFGIGMFSPLLDERGNSVRAIAAGRELAERFQLHLMHRPPPSAPVVYFTGTALTSSSPRERPREEREILRKRGETIRIVGVQGDLEFAAAETVLRALPDVTSRRDDVALLVLDLHLVSRLHSIAEQMLAAKVLELRKRGVTVVVADTHRRHLVATADMEVATLGEALEWSEDIVLALAAPPQHRSLSRSRVSTKSAFHTLRGRLRRTSRIGI